MPHPEPNDQVRDSHAFAKVRDGLLDLHELFLVGHGSSEKAKAIRDAADEPWFDLSDEQQETLNGLTRDLLDAQEVTSEPELESIPPVEPGVLEAVMLQHDGRYSEALELLRQHRSSKPFSRISFFRGRCWEELNEPRVALMFFNHAHKLAPTNEEYRAAALGSLAKAYPEQGRAKVQEILERAHAESPIVVIRACEIAFQTAQESVNEEKAKATYDGLTLSLHEALVNLQGRNGLWKPRIISEYQPIYSVVFSLIATCCRIINRIDAAFHYYTMAIGLDPLNAPLLIARGVSIYSKSQRSQQFAAEDFERAIMVGTDLVIPHYFLAHFLLHRGLCEACLKAVEAGIEKIGTDRMKSEMLEFRAIALAALGKSRETVLEAFRVAEKQDPRNERVSSNLRAYEEALRKRDQEAGPLNLNDVQFVVSIDAARIPSYLPPPPTLRDAQEKMAA